MGNLISATRAAAQRPILVLPATSVRRNWQPGSALLPQLPQPRVVEMPVDPLYMFYCGLLWRAEGDTGSGWELIHSLRSSDRNSREVAASLLAKTPSGRLLSRDMQRAQRLFRPMNQPALAHEIESGEVKDLKTPYGLEITENCQSCKLRQNQWFCGLSSEALRSFSSVTRPATYPGGAVLFVGGQMARGAFVLCSGRVKLSTTSREGKVLILRMAQAGEVLGLSAMIAGECYEFTAETAGPCQVNFVERQTLLRLMEKHGELGVHSAQALSREFQSVFRDIQELVLARSSAGKLARLLLSWSPTKECIDMPEPKIRSCMTHEEMAQMIGASRETVTRLLNELKKKQLIRLEGSTLVIRNRTALEAMAA